LGNTSGEMSRRRRVVINDDRLGAVRKIRLNPGIGQSTRTEKDGVVDAVKSSTKVERNEQSKVTKVGGMENPVKGSEETRFRGVARQIGG